MIDQDIPPYIERIIEVPFNLHAQLIKSAQKREHLTRNCWGLDSSVVETILSSNLFSVEQPLRRIR
jgi:hypothetical protein